MTDMKRMKGLERPIGEALAKLGDFEAEAAARRQAALDVARVNHGAHEAIANASRARQRKRHETVNRRG